MVKKGWCGSGVCKGLEVLSVLLKEWKIFTGGVEVFGGGVDVGV